jgi:site-specific DNA-methyltransferase (adenine-specific)
MISLNLLKGDCLEILKTIPDKSIDMVLTDPPYGTTACRWDVVIQFEPMWNELKRITKDTGAIVLFGSEPFSSQLRMSNLKMFKYDWIWEKPNGSNFVSVNLQPFRVHEIISVFGLKACTYSKKGNLRYIPQKTKGEPYRQKTGKSDRSSVHRPGSDMSGYLTENTGLRSPRSIQRFNSEKGLHPTQKPVALLEYLVKIYTLENETVLDFTMGSGSTGVACKNLNRNFIGIEMDDKYFEIAKERINP